MTRHSISGRNTRTESTQPASSTEPQPGATAPAGQDEPADFASVILASTEDAWKRQSADLGLRYEPPRLVLFSQAIDSACGFSSAAFGQFCCPADSKVYLDLSFFHDLDQRFGALGDFARAHVVTHEIGHHVQSLLGITDEVNAQQQQVSDDAANASSVRIELQADCLAGVWAHDANEQRQMLDPGDLEEGLRAAAAVSDDVIQHAAGRRVNPESWTHGSAEQRVQSFRRGLDSGDAQSCDRLTS